jgi:hypothetical protein
MASSSRSRFGRIQRARALPSELMIASTITVADEVRIDSSDPPVILEFLRFLREASAARTNVSWRARLGHGVPIAAITHLPPPAGGSGIALNPAVSVWREHYRPDRFVWRAGPGFVLLLDTRPGAPPRRGHLREPDVLQLFHQAQVPTACSAIRSSAALETLQSEGVLLQLGDMVLALPVRQRRPPIIYRRAMHTFESAFETDTLVL